MRKKRDFLFEEVQVVKRSLRDLTAAVIRSWEIHREFPRLLSLTWEKRKEESVRSGAGGADQHLRVSVLQFYTSFHASTLV